MYFVRICHVCQYYMFFYFHLKGIWWYLILCCHILHKNPSHAKRCFITIKDFMYPLNCRIMLSWAIVCQIPYVFGFVIFSILQLHNRQSLYNCPPHHFNGYEFNIWPQVNDWKKSCFVFFINLLFESTCFAVSFWYIFTSTKVMFRLLYKIERKLRHKQEKLVPCLCFSIYLYFFK